MALYLSKRVVLGPILVAVLLLSGCAEKVDSVQFSAAWDTGVFTHDLLLTYNGKDDLTEVDVQVVFVREDGQRVRENKFLARWKGGETQRINVAAHRYQKMELSGNAKRGGRDMRIDTYWNQEWKR